MQGPIKPSSKPHQLSANAKRLRAKADKLGKTPAQKMTKKVANKYDLAMSRARAAESMAKTAKKNRKKNK